MLIYLKVLYCSIELSICSCRLPKFKAEVKEMILVLLPTNIARFFQSNNDQAWRSNGHPDIYLTRAANLKYNESRKLEYFSMVLRPKSMMAPINSNLNLKSKMKVPPYSSCLQILER